MNDDSSDEEAAVDRSGRIEAQFDWATTTPSTAVVETVAIAADTEPECLDLLYDHVDPEALDDLFREVAGSPRPSLAVSFAYDGFAVTVERSGTVVVEPRD